MSTRSPTSLDRMQSAIQLCAFHYIAAAKARPSNRDYSLRFENNEYVFDAIRRANSTELLIEYQVWLGGIILRDLVESFSVFLHEIYNKCIQLYPDNIFSKTQVEFERSGLDIQLDAIKKDMKIDGLWIERFIGFNKARNCLAHRSGVVGVSDCNEKDALVIRILSPRKIDLDGAEGIDFIPVSGPLDGLARGKVVTGKAVGLRFIEREKRFVIGSKITLGPPDILEICQTFQLAASAFDALSPH